MYTELWSEHLGKERSSETKERVVSSAILRLQWVRMLAGTSVEVDAMFS